MKLYLKEKQPFGDPLDEIENSPLLKYVKESIKHIDIEVEITTTKYNEKIIDHGYNSTFLEKSFEEFFVKTYQFEINNDEIGIKGDVKCFLLFKDNKFVNEIVMLDDVINHNQAEIPYKIKVIMNNGIIEEDIENIHKFNVPLISSKGFLTISGISVDCPVFSTQAISDQNNGENISWPFVVHYDLELTKDVQLNLTASRNQIIFDETWLKFKEEFMKIIAKRFVEEINQIEILKSFVSLLNQYEDSERLRKLIQEENKIRAAKEADDILNT